MKLDKLSKKELADLAAKKNIPGRSKMAKQQLIEALEPLFSKTSARTKSVSGKDINGENVSGEANVGYVAETSKVPACPPKDEHPIPPFYDKDVLVLMPVDPSREYAYWEISEHTLNSFKSELRLSETRLVLKMFSRFNNSEAETASAPVERLGEWFFNIYAPETVIWSEIGIIDSNGAFHRILKSRLLKMPADKVSDIIDKETWLTIGGDLDKLYQLSGLGMGSPMNSRSVHVLKDIAGKLSENIGSSHMGASGNKPGDK